MFSNGTNGLWSVSMRNSRQRLLFYLSIALLGFVLSIGMHSPPVSNHQYSFVREQLQDQMMKTLIAAFGSYRVRAIGCTSSYLILLNAVSCSVVV